MSDEAPINLRAVADYFGLPGTAAVAKDFHVVRAIAALAAIDATPFRLVFGGGTALARAHKIIRRMSEDVDFKLVPLPAAPASRSAVRRHLGSLRTTVSSALQTAGFAFDPADSAVTWSMDSNRYSVWQLPYDAVAGAGDGLRPTIKVELNYAPLRRPAVMLPVRSFMAEALGRPPEVTEIACVSIVETAAEKLVSLTRRTAMEMAGAGRDPDPTLVRHIYDLHMMGDLVDWAEVAPLARAAAEADAVEFANQFPAYAADIPGETRKALHALQADPMHRKRYEDFIATMVHGEKPAYATALATVIAAAETMCRHKEEGEPT